MGLNQAQLDRLQARALYLTGIVTGIDFGDSFQQPTSRALALDPVALPPTPAPPVQALPPEGEPAKRPPSDLPAVPPAKRPPGRSRKPSEKAAASRDI
jgi:hypothetical protein